MRDKIKENFTESIQTKIAAAEALPEYIEKAALMMVHSLLSGHKIIACGNGGNAALAQIFASHLLNKFETERPSLPAISITPDSTLISAIATDTSFDEIYAKQVRALAQAGDILLAISHGGNSRNVIKAVEAAVSRDMKIVALTGGDGGEIAGLLSETDVEIRTPSPKGCRIEEMHLFVLNCISDLIDQTLFSTDS